MQPRLLNKIKTIIAPLPKLVCELFIPTQFFLWLLPNCYLFFQFSLQDNSTLINLLKAPFPPLCGLKTSFLSPSLPFCLSLNNSPSSKLPTSVLPSPVSLLILAPLAQVWGV